MTEWTGCGNEWSDTSRTDDEELVHGLAADEAEAD